MNYYKVRQYREFSCVTVKEKYSSCFDILLFISKRWLEKLIKALKIYISKLYVYIG